MTNPPEQPSEVERVADAINHAIGGPDVIVSAADIEAAARAAIEAMRAAPKKGLKIVPADPIVFEDDTEQRAATPAPMQDDDAELVKATLVAIIASGIQRKLRPSQITAEILADEDIAARLSTDTALVEALEPFARAAEIKLCGEWADNEQFCKTDVAFYLTFGDLRRAKAARDSVLASRGGDNGK